MSLVKVLLLCVLVTVANAFEPKFPAWFKFGAATSAYQVEGGWNASDKGESIWDRYTHSRPERIADHSNGDVACDSYHRWKEDVQLIVDLGLDYYRFSIAWARILPTGFSNHISEDGKNYYNNIINGLLANGVEPLVTMYHWQLPQRLQDMGGWTNPLIVDWFADYADVLFSLYGDRVKVWLTINEPVGVCDASYSDTLMAPAVYDPEQATYICNKNVLLAHAKAWRIYDLKYRPIYGGQVSLSNQVMHYEGLTDDDHLLADFSMHYQVGRFSHAIYSKEGGWPPVVERAMAEKSKAQGYSKSRLPAFTQEEKDFVRGTYDFYALNYYTSRTVRRARHGEALRPFFTGDLPEFNIALEARPEWQAGRGESWIYPPIAMNIGTHVVRGMYRKGHRVLIISEFLQELQNERGEQLVLLNPVGLRYAVRWLKKNYGDLNFMIMENGYSNGNHNLDDNERIMFMRKHLEQVLLAIHEDHLNITRYTYWSLLDNFEWMDGYNTKFGLYEVDFADPKRRRTARKSAYYYRSITESRSLDVPLQPQGWAIANYVLSTTPNSAHRRFLWSWYIYLPLMYLLVK